MNLRDLPSVHELTETVMGMAGAPAAGMPHDLVVREARAALDAARNAIRRGVAPAESLEDTVARALRGWRSPSLRRVINATGVVLHTNLGRAPLAPSAMNAGYGNLEYDLETGKRGKRDVHTGRLLEALLGAHAVVVNNNAAALFLALNELAAGGEAIVSRGELIEIGDGFRIPEIMAKSGATLREVGTTNRTHIGDYREAVCEKTRVLLRVHPSNFRISGFTARPELAELVALSRESGIPLYEDLGSGCLVDLRAHGIHEPLVRDSLASGVNLVSFSGDKLLGGPQAGIIAGEADLVHRVRRNPLFRALRQDKLFYQAMEATLRHLLLGEVDAIPALRMIRMSADEIRTRAERLAARIPGATVEAGESLIGGGSTPDLALPTWVVAVECDEKKLRAHDPPIVARVERARVLFDLRTVFPEEEEVLVQAVTAANGGGAE